jgi:hypothetical protein
VTDVIARFKRGESAVIGNVTLTEDDGTTPVDLTAPGVEITWQARRGTESTTAIAVDIDLTDGATGIARGTIDPEVTADMLTGTWLTDVRVVLADGTVRKSRTVEIVVEPDVTRPEVVIP